MRRPAVARRASWPRTISPAAVPTVLVTHDYEEAATLADEIGVIDGGRIVQRGSAAELAAAPGSAFVADLVGSVVLAGRAGHLGDAGTPIALDGGATIFTTDRCGPGEVVGQRAPVGDPDRAAVVSRVRLGAKPSRRERSPRSRALEAAFAWAWTPGSLWPPRSRRRPSRNCALLPARKSWRSGKLRRPGSSSDRRSVDCTGVAGRVCGGDRRGSA